MPWQCPSCGRSFGRRGQWHSCTRLPDLQDWLANHPPQVRGVLDAVRGHLDGLGADVLLEPTRDAVMIKRVRTFAEVEPRPGSIELAFIVSRQIDDARILRRLELTSSRTVHVVALADPVDVDGQVCGWLTEAYRTSPIPP
jgi:hypothetical protein